MPNKPSAEQYTFTDSNVAHRLNQLIEQVIGEVNNRGKLSGMGAGLRSWSNTSRVKAADVGAYSVKKGTALVLAIFLVPVIAASIGTFGALPIAAVIATVVGLAMHKLISIAAHARDVNAMLELVKKGEDLGSPHQFDWEKVRPGVLSAADVTGMAEIIFSKLVSDFAKLSEELTRTRVDYWAETQLWELNEANLVSVLLCIESEIHRGGRIESNGRRRAPADKWFREFVIYPLSAKSAELPKRDIPLHRLRRLRFYIRWLKEYMRDIQNIAFEAMNAANPAEQKILAASLSQVMIGGNHADCGSVCFAPQDTDLKVATVAAQSVSVMYQGAHSLASSTQLSTASAAVPKGLGAAGFNSAAIHNAKQQAVVTYRSTQVSMGVEAAVDNQVQALVGKVAELAGKATGEWVGGLVGDAIGAAASEAMSWYSVNRPLRERVDCMRQALRHSNDAGKLDSEIDALAKKNDIAAVLQAFLKTHSHYPKRIAERCEILRKELVEMEKRTNNNGGNAFNSCSEAAKAIRYLVKVFHQSEKLAVHALFVRIALEAIENKIFVEGYKRMMGPVLADVLLATDKDNFTHPNLKHVVTRVADPFAAERELARKAKAAKAEQERLLAQAKLATNKKAQLEALKLALMAETKRIRGTTYLTAAGLTSLGEPKPDSRPMTIDDWRKASSVDWKRRSDLTKNLDLALEQYLKFTNIDIMDAPRGAANGSLYVDFISTQGDVVSRLNSLRNTVLKEVDHWVADKGTTSTSNRLPAILKLKLLVGCELTLFQSLSDRMAPLAQRTEA